MLYKFKSGGIQQAGEVCLFVPEFPTWRVLQQAWPNYYEPIEKKPNTENGRKLMRFT